MYHKVNVFHITNDVIGLFTYRLCEWLTQIDANKTTTDTDTTDTLQTPWEGIGQLAARLDI